MFATIAHIQQQIKRFSINSSNSQIVQTGIGMVFLQGSVFLTGILIARGLGPEEQGKFQLMLSIAAFITVATKLGLDEGVAYFLPAYKIHESHKVFSLIAYALIISVFLGCVSALFVFLNSSWLAQHVFKNPGFEEHLAYSIYLIPLLMLLLMSMSILRGLGRSDLRATIYYFLVGASFFLLIFVFYIRGLTTVTAYQARIFSFAVGAAAGLGLIFKVAGAKFVSLRFLELRNLHFFGGLLVFVSMFQYIVDQPLIDLTIVSRVAGSSALGIYSVAAKVGSLVSIIPAAVVIVIGPQVAAAFSKGESAHLTRLYLQSTQRVAWLGFYLGFLILLMGREILLIFGEEYRQGFQLLAIILSGQVISIVFSLNTPFLLAGGYAWLEFIITGATAVVMVVLGIILGHYFFEDGVALSTSAALVLLSVCRYIAVKSIYKYSISTGFIIRVVGIGVLSFGLAAIIGWLFFPYLDFLALKTIQVVVLTASFWFGASRTHQISTKDPAHTL
jgi:O-antigen/teichoic acid export membrane protein